MSLEHATTYGSLQWDGTATSVEYADDPVQPDGDGWRLVSSAIGALRFSQQPILWFWEREKIEQKELAMSNK